MSRRLYKPQALAWARNGWRDDSSYRAFVEACKAAGDRNLVQELLGPFELVQRAAPQPDIGAALATFKPRPWYSAAELSRLWPLVCIGLACKQQGRSPSPVKLAERLTIHGLPKLRQWDGSQEFLHHGKRQEFFIVQDVWAIANQRYTQTDFDRVMTL